jgi:hypothetical protein
VKVTPDRVITAILLVAEEHDVARVRQDRR